MSNETKENSVPKEEWPLALFLVVFSVILLAPAIIAAYWKQSISNECRGHVGDPSIVIVDGKIEKFRFSYLIRGEKRNWIVFACGGGKGGCTDPLKPRFEAAIGMQAQAAFCNGEVRWVDLQGERVFERGDSFAKVLEFFAIAGAALVSVLVLFWLALRTQQRTTKPQDAKGKDMSAATDDSSPLV